VTRSLSRVQAIILGVVVLVCTGLSVWLCLQAGSRQRLWARTAEIRAGFSQTHGIDKGTPVRIRGVEAGQVVGVELPADDDPNGKVYLRLRIEKRFMPLLCADAKAKVVNEGMLGGRIINVDPGKDIAHKLSNGDEIAVVEPRDLTDLMQQAGQTLEEIRESNGTLAKLVKSDEAHKEVVSLVRDTQNLVRQGQETFRKGDEALTTLKQDADAIKRLPVIRNYIEDTTALLVRPDLDKERRVFSTEHLFAPDKSVLTDEGRQHLNNLTPWFEALRVKGSDIVVVTYAPPASAADPSSSVTQLLSQKQSDAVANYLRDQLRAGRVTWYHSRKITPVGMGSNLPPIPEKEPLPQARTEIIIFLPR
jgi:ABC-type transporter Mla subunit MlaD